jgi:ABC-type glycerol-3-phosphate transport system permease component
LILPSALAVSSIFFYRQYLQAMPDAFFDLGRIDGLGEIGVFTRVALPLSAGAIATLALLSVLSSWSSYMWPNAILFDPTKFTLPVGIQRIIYSEAMRASRNQFQPDFGLTMASATFMLMPMVIIFTAFHRWFAKGLWGGLK